MATKIARIKHETPKKISISAAPDDEEWVRPNDWPNLDDITIEDGEDVCYFTYDLRKTPGYAWLGFYLAVSSGNVSISRGHIENHTFISDDDYTGSGYFRMPLDSTYGDVQLWRVKPVNSSAHITSCYFCSNSGTTSECYYNQL